MPDTAASVPLGVQASPASSKRSRSRDSSRSAATSAFSTSTNTPSQTPSHSVPSLVIPAGSAQNDGTSSPQDPTPYPAFLRLTKAGIRAKFIELEWEQRRRMQPAAQQNHDPEQPSQWARCAGDDVMDRNRYANVDPYQSNRVKLQVPEGHSDYINASPIVLTSTRSKTATTFIATQGPKFDSLSHIWRMVWHETSSPAVIVMLTRTHESGREKCYPYFPRSPAAPDLKVNAHDEFDDGLTHDIKLVSLTQDEEARAEIRELDMATEDGNDTKKIWHLLFAGWPDFNVPEGAERDALLKLIEISRAKNADNTTNPRIVHCSAGVGRSGTFIALDWLLQELEEGSLDENALEDDDDPVLRVVEALRNQRMMMVQAEVQFSFIYDVMRERWRERWVRQHPEEAERLGISSIEEPRHKKARQMKAAGGEVSEEPLPHADGDPSADELSQLEAELNDAQNGFDAGKT